jgi:hypothetical protein
VVSTYKKLFIIAAVLGVVGAGASIFGISKAAFSPRSYVSQHYTRASRYDIGRDAIAYTSARSPALVSSEITRAWRPSNRYDNGGAAYLRYGDDSVVVKAAAAGGALILIEKMRTANTRYVPIIGNSWNYSTRQNSNRGGGSGTGK